MFESLRSIFGSLPTKQDYFYVLVHAHLIPHWHPARKECERIKREEKHVELWGNPAKAARGIPRDKTIRVCGAYRSLCVKDQLLALRRAGYNTVLYRKATINFAY